MFIKHRLLVSWIALTCRLGTAAS